MKNINLTEKVSVNINTSTLSSVDLLIDSGYYSNRSDFINQALRESIARQQGTLDRIIENRRAGNNPWFLGLFRLEQKDFLLAREHKCPIAISGYGILIIDENIEDSLVFETLQSIHVKGRVICKPSVKEHYGL